jgi:hypothetical protein
MRVLTNLFAAFIVSTYLVLSTWIFEYHGSIAIFSWKVGLVWLIIGGVGFLFLQLRGDRRIR